MIDEDHCVDVKQNKNLFVILSLYVDDILLASNNKDFILTIKEWLSSHFDMKDMGEAEFILGVKIQRDRSKKLIALCQEQYIYKVLDRFNMLNCKPMDTPIARGESLNLQMCPKTEEEKQQMSRIPYSNAVGSLMYAMICTRPDIAYAIGLVSRFQSDPGMAHWKAIKRILRYLKGTAKYSICYQGNKCA